MPGTKGTQNRHGVVMTRPARAATLDGMAIDSSQRVGSVPTSAAARADALRDLLTVAPGIAPFGFALGIVIASSVMGDGAGLLGAPLVYGGSAQLTATTMFRQGAGLLAIVVSALTVSARLLLYSASLAPRFAGQPRWFRLVGPHFIIDQTYLWATARPDYRGPAFRAYWLHLGLGVMAVWSAAVGAGVLVGPRLPPLPHLMLAVAALFVGMLTPRLRDRAGVAAAVTAATVAPIAAQFVPTAGVITGAAAGLAVGMVVKKERSE
jgi:branched chain amino acid efflux pump